MISRQQAAERVSKAFQDGKAKETRKHKAGAAKRAAFTTTIGAWLVRLIGGRGGISPEISRPRLGPEDLDGE